jgi:hypothetical protein
LLDSLVDSLVDSTPDAHLFARATRVVAL